MIREDVAIRRDDRAAPGCFALHLASRHVIDEDHVNAHEAWADTRDGRLYGGAVMLNG